MIRRDILSFFCTPVLFSCVIPRDIFALGSVCARPRREMRGVSVSLVDAACSVLAVAKAPRFCLGIKKSESLTIFFHVLALLLCSDVSALRGCSDDRPGRADATKRPPAKRQAAAVLNRPHEPKQSQQAKQQGRSRQHLTNLFHFSTSALRPVSVAAYGLFNCQICRKFANSSLKINLCGELLIV